MSTTDTRAFPDRDPSKPAEQQGLFEKFRVQRLDGSDCGGGKHYGCRYFVLDMDHDAHAPAALRAYAASCSTTHPELSADLAREFGQADTEAAKATGTAAHPDDIAVDRFAVAMKAKMAASRAKGRSGWDDESRCAIGTLAHMLMEHVAKGDPVDIANFAMMLHQREAMAMEHHPCYGGMAAKVIKAYSVPEECHKCKGTGECDSGGTYPWGEGVSIPCDCEAARQPAPVVTRMVDVEDVKQLCRDYSSRTGSVYIGDVEAALDGLAALAATAAPVLMPEGMTIKAFQAAHDNAWHITIKHPFGESSVRMSNQRDIQLAELIAATNRSQP